MHDDDRAGAAELVGSAAAVDVAGVGPARFVQPADHLLRPSSGQVLSVEGRPVARTVEGYLWRRMPAPSWSAPLWALLLPFALLNVAVWMLPPARLGPSMRLATLLRGLLRLLALWLTALFVAQLTVVMYDLIGAQCLRPDTGCLAAIPDAWRMPWARGLAAIGVVTLVVLLIHRAAVVSWRPAAPPRPVPPRPAPPWRLPGAALAGDADNAARRALHTAAGLATAGFLAAGGPLRSGDVSLWVWAAPLSLLGLMSVAVVALHEPTPASPRRWVHRALGRWPRRGLITVAIGVAVLTALRAPPRPGLPSSSEATVVLLGGLLLAGTVVFGVLLIPAVHVVRPSWSRLPRALRPWAGGWCAAPVLVTGLLLGAGYGAGLGLVVRELLGRPLGGEPVVPAAYLPVTAGWGASALLLVVLAVLAVPVTALALALRGGAPVELGMLHPSGDAGETVRQAWRSARRGQAHLHHVGLAVVAVIALVMAGMWWLHLEWPGLITPTPAGVGVLSLAGIVCLTAVTYHRPAATPRLGLLSQLTWLWPRDAHPYAPPCSAVKAVPDLVDRVEHHLSDPSVRVVLVGVGQGCLAVTAAAAALTDRLSPDSLRRVGLVTAGASMQWAYSRSFPAVFGPWALAELSGELEGRWRGLCRGTDQVGGAVTTWERQLYDDKLLGVGYRSDGSIGALSAAWHGPHGGLVLGGDHWLPDPQRPPISPRRWHSRPLRHEDYPSDPEWDVAVALAAGLRPSSEDAMDPETDDPGSLPEQRLRVTRAPKHRRPRGASWLNG